MSSCLNANVARAAAVRRSIAPNPASFTLTMGAVRPCFVYDRRGFMRGTMLEPAAKIYALALTYPTLSDDKSGGIGAGTRGTGAVGRGTTWVLAMTEGRVVPQWFQRNQKRSLICARSRRGARRALCISSDEIRCVASRFVGMRRPRSLAFNQGVPGSSPGRLTSLFAGGNYTSSGGVVGWFRGVDSLASTLRPPGIPSSFATARR